MQFQWYMRKKGVTHEKKEITRVTYLSNVRKCISSFPLKIGILIVNEIDEDLTVAGVHTIFCVRRGLLG